MRAARAAFQGRIGCVLAAKAAEILVVSTENCENDLGRDERAKAQVVSPLSTVELPLCDESGSAAMTLPPWHKLNDLFRRPTGAGTAVVCRRATQRRLLRIIIDGGGGDGGRYSRFITRCSRPGIARRPAEFIMKFEHRFEMTITCLRTSTTHRVA